MENKLVIVNTDVRVSDVFGFLLLLNPIFRHVRVLAIATTFGNPGFEDTLPNVHAVLQATGMKEPPTVYKGSSKPLVRSYSDRRLFGPDDLNMPPKYWPTKPVVVPTTPAAMAMVELARKYRGQITVLSLGTLTNLALAQQLDPSFSKLLKEVIIMGGTKDGKGNQTPAAEFNFYQDPDAAKAVLERFECPITMVPLETCMKAAVPVEFFSKILNTTHSNLLNNISREYLRYYQDELKEDTISLDDLFAAAALLEPGVVRAQKMLPVAVETGGRLSRGACVIDYRKGKEPDLDNFSMIKVVMEFDVKKMKKLITHSVWGKI